MPTQQYGNQRVVAVTHPQYETQVVGKLILRSKLYEQVNVHVSFIIHIDINHPFSKKFAYTPIDTQQLVKGSHDTKSQDVVGVVRTVESGCGNICQEL